MYRFLVALLLPLAVFGNWQPPSYGGPRAIQPSPHDGHWVTTWTAMPQLTEFANLPPPPFNQTELTFFNSTIRQTIHVSTGAKQIRLRISNAFGLNDLPITRVTIALPLNGLAGASAIIPHTLTPLTFSGNESITIPDGSLAVSDPVNLSIKPESILTITIYLATGQASQYINSHPGSRTTSYFTLGDYTSAANLTSPSTTSAAHWFFISALEAWSPPPSRAFVVVGDSITDGRGSTTDANNRWPDLLLHRMQTHPSTKAIAVANQAAGGNRILNDGLGPNTLSRIDRDVLSQSGVKYAMIFSGVNDIGTADPTPYNQTLTYNRMIQAYEQIITRVHAFGIPIFGATITPFGAPNSTIQPYALPIREATRDKVNTWIRTNGKFDAVIDFDAVVRDPKNHTQLNPAYNSGDYLHPSVAGYQAMADAFPLGVFSEFQDGVGTFM